jgi:hypothetical protein
MKIRKIEFQLINEAFIYKTERWTKSVYGRKARAIFLYPVDFWTERKWLVGEKEG